MNRRTFLQAGTVAAAVSLELSRHGLDEAPVGRDDSSAEEWCEVVREHGFAYMTTAPHEMFEALTVDILALQYATDGHQSGTAARDLRRCGALMAALMAMTVANLGRLHETRRWWRTARTLADRSGDPTTRAWIRGSEVVRGLYEQRPVGLILTKAHTYVDELQGVPRSAMVELLGGEAQALALAGRSEDARNRVPRFLEACTSVTEEVKRDGESRFGWSTDRERYTESYVYSHTSDVELATAAQDAAVALYPPTYLRGPAQIELQRALCLQKIGDSHSATAHALTTLQRLPATERIRPVVDLAHKVSAAVPAVDARMPEVVTYREFLTSVGRIEAV